MRIRKILKLWSPVFVWMLLIFIGSSIPGASVSENRTVDFVAHKIVHLFEYSVLFVLIYRAVKKSAINSSVSIRNAAVGKIDTLISFGLTVGYAITDETHQMFVRGRDPKLHDVLIDTFAALLGWLALGRFQGWSKAVRRVCIIIRGDNQQFNH